MKAVFLDLATLGPRDLDLGPLESVLSDWQYHDSTTLAEVEERVADADIVVTNKVEIDRYTLDRAKNLKLICVAATGMNNIDLEAAKAADVQVKNCEDYSTASVTQHTIGLMLSLFMSLTKYHARVVRGAWKNSYHFCLLDFPVHEVAGKTLAIVGYGTIGRKVAAVAEALDMRVEVAQLPGRPTVEGRIPLEELLSRCDVLSIHCPLTTETQNLIGRRELKMMKPQATVLNTARGGIIDEQALANALRNKELGGAGIDVLSTEPPDDEQPLMNPDIPNLIVTPHTAWTSQEARQRLVQQLANNIAEFINAD